MVLGNFIYTNMPMVADLENNLESFAGNDLIAAIAGVEEAPPGPGRRNSGPVSQPTRH